MNPLGASEPATVALYGQLLNQVQKLGPFAVEMKKTSIHWTRKSAFAGIHPRRQSFILTVKSDRRIDSERIAKAEQVSKSRWHLDLKLTSPEEVDAELLGWLKEAYELCG
jgi:hypothetical protein